MTVMGPIADYQTNLNEGPLTASAFAKAFRRLSTISERLWRPAWNLNERQLTAADDPKADGLLSTNNFRQLAGSLPPYGG